MFAFDDEHDRTMRALFREEASEHFEVIGRSLEAARHNAGERGAELRATLRAAHSLKGAATISGLSSLQAMVHNLESCVSAIAAAKLPLGDVELDLLQRWLDAAHDEMESYCAGRARSLDPAQLFEQLGAHFSAHCALKEVTFDPAPEAAAAGASEAERAATVRVAIAKIDRQMANVEELLRFRFSAEDRLLELARVSTLVERWCAMLSESRRHARRQKSDGTRVAALIEEQHALGERVTEALAALHARLRDGTHALTTLTDSLHSDIRAVRMLPVSGVLAPFGRMVRELGRGIGKRVALRIVGGETEVDRDVLEAIKDPIMHLLRNAVDHGVEAEEQRRALGKPLEALIEVRVSSRGGSLELEISDDGRGVSSESVARVALERGLATAEQLREMSEDGIVGLIFHEGFSTAREVSEVSGRGVGLAVVQSTVEKLGGRVSVESAASVGCCFKLVLPLNLATMRLLLVEVEARVFAFPATAIERVVRVAPGAISLVDQGHAFELDGKPVPVFRLGENLGLPTSPLERERLIAVVLASTVRRAAFIVDRILDEQELVARGLGDHLTTPRNISGATVLADGRVAPILNAGELLAGASGGRAADFAVGAEDRQQKSRRVLVVDDSVTTRTLEKSILEAAGYEVQVATDGVEALERLSRLSFDLILSDVQMPRVDGLALVRAVRQDARLKGLPVVLVSSLDSAEQRAAGLEAGADAYLSKAEFEQGLLLATLARFV